MATDINKVDDEVCQRIAFILVDQALELAARSFLQYHINLVPRVITLKEWKENQHRFPYLHDKIKHHSTKLTPKMLRQWKFHHHTRNSLYHNPLPLSIDSTKVEEFITFAYKFHYALFRKKRKRSRKPFWEKQQEYLKWEVFFPKTLPRHSSSLALDFEIIFKVRNISEESALVKIWVESTSPAVGFRLIPPRKVGRIRRKLVDWALYNEISLDIGEQQDETFTFLAIYRPQAIRPFSRFIVIEFGAILWNEEGEEEMNIGPKRIEIPIK